MLRTQKMRANGSAAAAVASMIKPTKNNLIRFFCSNSPSQVGHRILLGTSTQR
jgi:hypothetical protein